MKKIYEIIIEALWAGNDKMIDVPNFIEMLEETAWNLCSMFAAADFKATMQIYDYLDETIYFDPSNATKIELEIAELLN